MDIPKPTFNELYGHLFKAQHRAMALELLRDIYRLRISDCIHDNKEQVEKRRLLYLQHRAKLEEIWLKEDNIISEINNGNEEDR